MADSKLTALTALTSATSDDLVYVVNDPLGTPASRKMTFANFEASLTVANQVGGNVAVGEVPSGTVDGVNAAFTLAHTPVSGTVAVYLNGARQQGSGADYSISSTTVTFTAAPLTGSIILVDYRY